MSEENKFEQENEDIENLESIDPIKPTEALENANDIMSVDDFDIQDYDDVDELPTELEMNIEDLPEKREWKRPPLGALIVSVIAAMLATFMLTYTVCTSIYQANIAKIYKDVQTQLNAETEAEAEDSSAAVEISEKTVIDFLLQQYFYGDVDVDKLTVESLRAYLAATGDIYAAYYTQEEIESSYQEGAGKMQGIGVNIINSTVNLGGVDYAVLKITNVMKGSPAQEHGLRAGDMIYSVGTAENKTLVNDLGYDEALKLLKGSLDEAARFSILRKTADDKYEEKYFSVTKREVVTDSVYSRVLDGSSKIGVVRILDFELNTPTQFENAIEDLKKQGCEKFVIDVRYNPGGYLISIAAVLSYFLDEGDVYIRTADKAGNITQKTIGVVDVYKDDYEPCNVSKDDIGKYKNLNMVVLCNEYTASAAELFTATFRDYGLGKIVGTTTFGKGKMQTTYSLEMFGLEGAVKFTTHMYYSAKSEGYDGVGIKPDEGCDIPLSEEAKQYNIYDLPDNLDNQLQEAIQHFK